MKNLVRLTFSSCLNYFSVLKVHGAFRFENHYFIVLDLYETTLLSMVCLPDIDSNDGDMSQKVGHSKSLKSIHQPR